MIKIQWVSLKTNETVNLLMLWQRNATNKPGTCPTIIGTQSLAVRREPTANLHITNIISSREKRIPYACVHMNDA